MAIGQVVEGDDFEPCLGEYPSAVAAHVSRAADDQAAFRRHVHSLRGITGTVRAGRMFERLADRSGELDLKALRREFQQTRAYVVRELGLEPARSVSRPVGSQ